MFVLLEHTTDGAVHWDLLVETPDSDRLAAWRLLACPLTTETDIRAEPIPPHRRAYLDYEGEISGGRGRVRRLDRGAAELLSAGTQGWRIRLHGMHLAGTFEITFSDDARFRRCRPAGPSPV